MRKYTLFALACAMICLTACSSTNTKKQTLPKIDGNFEGVIPCADCAGIKINMEFDGKKYTKNMVYQGKNENSVYQSKGTWKNETGNVIKLSDAKYDYHEFWAVEDAGKITMLDLSKKPIETELNYSVRRVVPAAKK